MGLTAAVLISATVSVGTSIANYNASQDAANAQSRLAAEQAQTLRDQQAASSEQAKTQAKTGVDFGFANESVSSPLSGFGFGAAPNDSPNSGRRQITGMG